MKARWGRGLLAALCLLALWGGTACARQEAEPAFSETEEGELPEEEPLPEPEPEPVIATARLTVVGDIMCHDYQYNEAYDPQTGTYDFSHCFADMQPYFDQADLVVGNLETVFAGPEVGPRDFPLFNAPDEFLDAVKNAGFDLLTTANNHCLDQGEKGVLRTLDRLDELGIAHVGTYRNLEEKAANKIQMLDVNGVKLAVLAYTYGFNGNYVPSYDEVSLLDEATVKADLAAAREAGPDFVVVLAHLGNEYETEPRQTFVDWVQLMCDAGADLVLCSHPHVLQRMEFTTAADGRRCFVMYSLGNFISAQTTPPRNASILLDLTLTVEDGAPRVSEVSFVPIWTQFRLPSGRDHFVVRSVYQMLSLTPEQQAELLRPKDVARLKDIHTETTSLLLGKTVPLEDIKDQYWYYREAGEADAALSSE